MSITIELSLLLFDLLLQIIRFSQDTNTHMYTYVYFELLAKFVKHYHFCSLIPCILCKVKDRMNQLRELFGMPLGGKVESNLPQSLSYTLKAPI